MRRKHSSNSPKSVDLVDYAKLKNAELLHICRLRGLSCQKGNRTQLVGALMLDFLDFSHELSTETSLFFSD